MPWIEFAEHRVHYRRSGAGPPVILLHASSSHSGQWKPFMARIADRFTCIAPDFHGYGRSMPLPEDGRLYFYHDAKIVVALMDEFDEPVHLVGHSLGGTVAARIALTRGESLASLTLIEPVLFCLLEESGDPRRQEYLELADRMARFNEAGENRRAADIFLEFWTGPGSLDRLDDETRKYVIATIGRVIDDWRGISMSAPGQVKLAELGRISVPTLILCGQETRASAHGIVEILVREISGMKYREIPNAGHMSPITHAENVNAEIEAFINRLAG